MNSFEKVGLEEYATNALERKLAGGTIKLCNKKGLRYAQSPNCSFVDCELVNF
jgi:hypothetical protein